MGRRVWVAAALLCATCAPKRLAAPPAPGPSQRWADGVDWAAAEDEAVDLLSRYLQVDTINPPGNEAVGAAFLAGELDRVGVPSEIEEFLPGRANLIARLRGSGEEPPLCLLSHMDVVSADPDGWSKPPLSGEVDADGYIWGRGALDMKSVGVVELLGMAWLQRLGVPLRRDVILLAVGDEEVNNLGIRWLADHRWGDIGCTQLINEGGLGVRDAMVEGVTVFAVSFVEKGNLWLRLVATGEPGHGSTPLPDSAPMRLLDAVERLRGYDPKPVFHPELHRLLGAVGERAGGLTGAVLRSPGLTRSLAAGRLMDNPLSRALLTNTVNITGFGGAREPNVVPSEAWAQLDVRLLPGVTPEVMLAELKALVGEEPWLRWEVLDQAAAVESPTDDPLFRSIVDNVQRAWPEAAVGPFIMMGSTDATIVRPLGVHAYGIVPFELSQDELRGFHGNDERLHRDQLGKGLEVMLRILLDAAAKP
ncbi:MAG TPA: M20/M25/M40 family metallo-hydrolase [Myxococcota bacterium]|nr:M20/M25/M40 family metallo-hydrolase [Myxococcota bacterium]